MSKSKRVWNIIGSVFVIQAALLLMLIPSDAFEVIAAIVGSTLFCQGIKYLLYYLTHAQHMIGGKWLLLTGLILFDMGAFALVLIDQAQAITIIYVVGVHLIAAIINIARTVSNKGDGNPAWKIDLAQEKGEIDLLKDAIKQQPLTGKEEKKDE